MKMVNFFFKKRLFLKSIKSFKKNRKQNQFHQEEKIKKKEEKPREERIEEGLGLIREENFTFRAASEKIKCSIRYFILSFKKK